MDYHIRMYIDIFKSVDSLILLHMYYSFRVQSSHLLKSLERQIFRNGGSIIKECCTTSFFNCCLASNINLVLLGTYVIGKDPRFDPLYMWCNEIQMNQHQVRKLIKIVSKMGPKMAIKLFVYTLSKTTTNCRMVSKNSVAFVLLPIMSCVR